MPNYVEIAEISVSDLEFFIDQLELFLNNIDILKMVGDEEIRIERPVSIERDEITIGITGRIRGKIGLINVKRIESSLLPRESIIAKGVLIKNEIPLPTPNISTPPTEIGKPMLPTIDIPLIQGSCLYRIKVMFLRTLPIEFLEVVKTFIIAFREIPRPKGFKHTL